MRKHLFVEFVKPDNIMGDAKTAYDVLSDYIKEAVIRGRASPGDYKLVVSAMPEWQISDDLMKNARTKEIYELPPAPRSASGSKDSLRHERFCVPSP
jgi:hypothetical protein